MASCCRRQRVCGVLLEGGSSSSLGRLALVWAPNLLRSPDTSRAMVSEESLRDIGVQARAVEFMKDE